MPDITERPYQSGGSAPTYSALDRARNNLDALKARRFGTGFALSRIVEQAARDIGASVADARRAHDQIADLVTDLFFDREAEITNEITDLEDRLGDDA